ncbi:MAG: hypothetical protein WC552_09600 [Candidatus Omnitrophota bacterium]
MTKIIVYTLIVFAFLSSLANRSAGLVFLGIAVLVVAIYVANKDAIVLEHWSYLIGQAQGNADKLMLNTKAIIEDTKAPALEIIEEAVGPSLSKTPIGETREFLVVINNKSLKFRSYKIFVNANDYGNNLFVSWYLTYKPDWWHAAALLLPGARQVMNVSEISLFDLQDLAAYATTVHNSFLAAVDKLMLELNQDPNKIDRKTRGFLGIS